MWRKIVGIIILILLFVGSICGIVFGIKYSNLKNSDIEKQHAQLQIEFDELQQKYDQVIEELEKNNAELYQLQVENESNKSFIEELESENSNLKSQKEELENQIIYLNELLSAYERENKLIVTFYVKDTIHTLQVVEENECINPAEIITPTLDGHKFLYWSLDGQNEIDFSSTPITEDTSVYAVFESFTLFSGLKSITLGSKNSYEVDLNDYFDIELSDRDISVQFEYVIASPYGENDSATLSLSQNNSFLAKNHYGTWATITLIDTTLYFKNEGYTDVFGSLSVTIYEIIAEK